MKLTTLAMSLVALLGISFALPAAAANEKFYGSELCSYSGFKCIKIVNGDTWAKLFPDRREREIVKRLNRTNAALRHRSWIIIPTNLNDINYMDLSPFPSNIEPSDRRTVIVNLSLQAFGAYDKLGKLVHWGPISAGRGFCEDVGHACITPPGDFKVYRKQGQDCISTQFPVETSGGSPMPYCMHYYQGYALHGSILPGFNASHGCVRLFMYDAKWLNQHFVDIGTRVIVVQ